MQSTSILQQWFTQGLTCVVDQVSQWAHYIWQTVASEVEAIEQEYRREKLKQRARLLGRKPARRLPPWVSSKNRLHSKSRAPVVLVQTRNKNPVPPPPPLPPPLIMNKIENHDLLTSSTLSSPPIKRSKTNPFGPGLPHSLLEDIVKRPVILRSTASKLSISSATQPIDKRLAERRSVVLPTPVHERVARELKRKFASFSAEDAVEEATEMEAEAELWFLDKHVKKETTPSSRKSQSIVAEKKVDMAEEPLDSLLDQMPSPEAIVAAETVVALNEEQQQEQQQFHLQIQPAEKAQDITDHGSILWTRPTDLQHSISPLMPSSPADRSWWQPSNNVSSIDLFRETLPNTGSLWAEGIPLNEDQEA